MKYLKIVLLMTIIVSCGSLVESGQTLFSNEAGEWITLMGKRNMPHVVLVSGDEEYRSEEGLPQLAKILTERHGFKTTVLFAQNPAFPGVIDPNYTQNIPGLESLESADLLIILTRFRALPDDQMKYLDDYLMAGKPVLGMRTATHAFNFRGETAESPYAHYGNGSTEWQGGFGRQVLGEKWIAHHGGHKHQSTKGLIAPGVNGHAILNGIKDGDVWGPSDVYTVRLPLPGDSKPIILGQVVNRAGEFDETDLTYGMRATDSELPGPQAKKDRDGNEIQVDKNSPMMPVAWTKSYQLPGGKAGKSFNTTLGASTDLLSEGTRRLIINASFWGLSLDVPSKANVDLVGIYAPSQFGFKDDEYWKTLNIKISEMK
jgi:hypothetical protein